MSFQRIAQLSCATKVLSNTQFMFKPRYSASTPSVPSCLIMFGRSESTRMCYWHSNNNKDNFRMYLWMTRPEILVDRFQYEISPDGGRRTEFGGSLTSSSSRHQQERMVLKTSRSRRQSDFGLNYFQYLLRKLMEITNSDRSLIKQLPKSLFHVRVLTVKLTEWITMNNSVE
jgi:hypothetical protein